MLPRHHFDSILGCLLFNIPRVSGAGVKVQGERKRNFPLTTNADLANEGGEQRQSKYDNESFEAPKNAGNTSILGM